MFSFVKVEQKHEVCPSENQNRVSSPQIASVQKMKKYSNFFKYDLLLDYFDSYNWTWALMWFAAMWVFLSPLGLDTTRSQPPSGSYQSGDQKQNSHKILSIFWKLAVLTHFLAKQYLILSRHVKPPARGVTGGGHKFVGIFFFFKLWH